MSLEERVTALEAEVTTLREQVTDTHTLAAHADRDVAEFRAELRAQTRLISALRETQVEQGAEIVEIKTDIVEIKVRLTSMDAKFDEQRDGMAHIVRLLEGLTSSE